MKRFKKKDTLRILTTKDAKTLLRYVNALRPD